ncbi:MAG: hypothetical protein ACYCY6_00695 [Minisyncoccota bacterium]
MIKRPKNLEEGQVMILITILFLMVSLTMVLGFSGPVFRSQRSTSDLLESKKSYYLAEAGVEDVAYRLSNGLDYSTDGQILSIDNHSVSVNTETVNGRKVVTATSDWNGSQKSIEARLAAGDGVAFYYGVQIGQGGFSIGNNAGINGSVYSNGNITGGNGSFITGSAVAVGSINNVDVGTGTTSDAWASQINNLSVSGDLYCQSGTGNNKSCDTSRGAPATQGFPIQEEEINGWKADASLGGTYTGNRIINSNISLGPLKIDGDLIISGTYTLTVTGTIWVTGDIVLSNSATIRLSGGYAESGGVVVSDGPISLGNSVFLLGSGQSSSHLLLVSLDNSSAINMGNSNAVEVILYAPNGTISVGNNASLKSITAKTIALGNGIILNYSQGLLDSVFSSGPTGGFQLDSWKETR